MRRVRDVLLFTYRDENPQLLERHVCFLFLYMAVSLLAESVPSDLQRFVQLLTP